MWLFPGYTDDERSAHLLGEFIGDMDNVEMVELLPYHELGAHKWALCGDEYKLTGVHPPPKETILKIKEILESYGKILFIKTEKGRLKRNNQFQTVFS